MEEKADTEVEEAGQVFLLMKKDYRISRNVRLAWFLTNLHQSISPLPESELGPHDLEVVSVIPHGWQPDEPLQPGPYLLVPTTWVTFLARRYRFVIELDLSPSTGIVDDSTEEIIFDEIFHSLSRCLLGLLRPFRVPGSNILFRPEIFVTIQAYSSIIGLQSHQVLVQGCQLEEQKLPEFLQHVYLQLGTFENKIAEMLQQQYRPLTQDCLPQYGYQQSGKKMGVSMVTADIGLVSMIRQGILALQLLPANSSAGIIVITDGVTSVPDVAICETLLNQLRSGTIACSFVQVGGVYSYDCSFGYIPNVELMKFIAMATLGSYLSSCPEVETGQADMNVYHKAFLLYSFLRTGEALNPEYYCGSQHKLFNEHLVSASSNPALATRRRKHAEKELHADIISVVSVRLREGYSIREIRITKALLEVKLVLLWKHNMRVEYLAMAAWPLDASKRSTRVEVVMEGSYDILHDISCTLKKPITSIYRTSVIRRFWYTLQSISQTDQMLVHLKSFDTVPEHYKIPESTKNGVPLFYIPPGSTTPVLSLQHSDSDSCHSQFASYWKPILSMDANVWQRWLHVHRLVLLLEHDMPVPKHLHTPGNNGRYSTVLCRISHTALTSLLRDWSSFVLVESYSYVKLMLSDVSQIPTSFCVVRIIWKAPCMVLRLGFPLGTPANCRNQIVEELRDRILQLRFPQRVQSKETTPRVKRKMFGISSPSKSPPPQVPPPAFSDRCCLVLLHKPLEKLLIKYDKLPLDYRTPFILNLESLAQHTSVPGPPITSRSASSTLASLSRYFYHQRWIWSVQSSLTATVPIVAMAQILSTLTEIRLSEGFHFASSGEGIINMVLEVPIQSDSIGEGSIEKHSCIIQYILFPPHVTSTKDSFSTDEDNDTEVEAIEQDTELHLVSECWVEPQIGYVMGTCESWKHLQGLTYSEIPQALFPRDQSCINIMLTFEYIVQLCRNKDGSSPTLTKTESPDPPESGGLCIREVPFHFGLMKLLPKCQQIEMFFVTLSRAETESQATESSLPNDMLLSLFHNCLQSDLNDQEIPLDGQDHLTFMEHVLQRDREGNPAPFLYSREGSLRSSVPSEAADSSSSSHASHREPSNSTSTVQSPCPIEEMDDSRVLSSTEGHPQWRCYARLVNPQHLLLTFLPATFSDVQKLLAPPDVPLSSAENSVCTSSTSMTPPCSAGIPTLSVTPAVGNGHEAEHRRETHISFSRQSSLQDISAGRRLRCPVYVYNCSLEALREQLVSPRQQRSSCDVFFRSSSQERPSASSFIHHRQKELVGYCNLLQEHYHQCYVKGLFKALQQSLWVSHQDLLTAVDYCEEQLQEIDITNFLMTLCGHLRSFRESQAVPGSSHSVRPHKASFRIGSLEQEEEPSARDSSALHSESSLDTEECAEQEVQDVSILEPSSNSEFQLSLLETGQPCEVSPDLHRIIQDKFLAIGSLHFKTVPSNPHYFFFCPSSQRREEDATRETGDRKTSEDMETSEAEQANEEGNTSTGGITTESDSDLEVEYREHSDNGESLSGSETVNQDDDSFSVLGGDSLNGQDLSEHEMPPLFVHLICSVTNKNQHGSMPVLTLPTCLGEVIGCLENSETLQSISLADLSVMLDIYVLTLPLEIDGVNEDSQHTRYTSESSVSYPRSPAQPSSYRSDEEIPLTLERYLSNGDQRFSALSRLPAEHRQAIEVTMSEIRWLLEDELVSALRYSRLITPSILQKVLSHVCESKQRPHCHRELVKLQFVFGPEKSLERFKEEFHRLSLPGYQLNQEEEDYYYVSLNRLHAHRVENIVSQHLNVQGQSPWQDSDGGTATESVEEDLEPKMPPKSCHSVDKTEEDASEWAASAMEMSDSEVSSVVSGMCGLDQGAKAAVEASLADRVLAPQKTSSVVSLPESVQSSTVTSTGGSRPRPSRVQSLVSSHGSMDSDHLGYDAGSSDSECEDALISEQDSRSPVMPKFWLIVKIHQDWVEVCTHASAGAAQEVEELGESQRLHQLVVRKVGEICRVVNQRLLLQNLHDTHQCHNLLVAESEDDLWKTESPYTSRWQRMVTNEDYPGEEDYLAATMHFMPGYFACDVVWSTVIHIHPRLKMGPNLRALQSLHSVLSAFSVSNRKNMFVYQERSTKSVFYLRLSETSGNGRLWEMDLSQSMMSRSLALSHSQEPTFSEDMMGSRLSLDLSASRNSDSARPVGQIDKHILLLVHGVGEAGSEITDDLVKVLRKRLDETTLDIITVMLQRNCKLTPADVEFIQPRGTAPTEVLLFTIPQSSLPCLQAMAYYLRQNLLIFLHTPKYTDSNGEHHFQHYYHNSLPELDLFLYNKPGGQGTGGKGIACIALSFVDQHGALVTQAYGERSGPPLVCPSTASHLLSFSTFESLTKVSRFMPDSSADTSAPLTLVRFDIWEKGNISSSQLSERLSNSLRHALCDVIIEFHILQMPLCVDPMGSAEQEVAVNGKDPTLSHPDTRELTSSSNKSRPSPINLTPSVSQSGTDPSTPPSKTGRRSFWDMLSKPDSAELGPPKTTDDIVCERTEEPRTRRRHKTESLKVPSGPDKPGIRMEHAQRKRQVQLEEGDVGFLHPLYSQTCLQWMNFMNQLGCPSIQLCSAQTVSRFLLPSVLTELFNVITSLASDTNVRVFEKTVGSDGPVFVPYSTNQHSPARPAAAREMILLGRNFRQWRYSTEQVYSSEDEEEAEDGDKEKSNDEGCKLKRSQKGFQRFEAMEPSSAERPLDISTSMRGLIPRQRFLLIEIQDKKLTLYTYNWSPDLGASLSRSLVRLIQWQNARAHVVHCLLSQKLGLFHHYCFSETPWHEDSKQDPNPFLNSTLEVDALIRSSTPPPYKEQTRLGNSARSLPSLHYPPDIVPFDEVLRDVMPIKPMHLSPEADTVSCHGAQFLEIKSTERREMEKQLKIENLFVTWQQRSAQSNMPISAADLDTLKQSARLVHYCATPLLFDPSFQAQVQSDQGRSEGKKRHQSNDSGTSGRDRSYSCDSNDMPLSKAKEEPWLQELCTAFMQQYIQYLQSTGFILVQLRPASPVRSTARIRPVTSLAPENRTSKPKSEGSPKSTISTVTTYHLQRALPGGIVLMELSFQGCYFCVKQYALECSRIPMGQSVNSQGLGMKSRRAGCQLSISRHWHPTCLNVGSGGTHYIRNHCKSTAESASESALSMLFTEECDKVRDLMHVHSFSYDFHLRVLHQYLLGSSMSLRQGYDLSSFLQLFISQHPDIPKYGRNHVYQGMLSVPTEIIAAHQLYNYIADHASTYHMKPLRMVRPSLLGSNGKKSVAGEQNEYGLVSIWNSSGSYKDSEGARHHDDFDVSLLVCHSAVPFEEQTEQERHFLRLRFYVIMTSQRELFPRLTADMRRFKKPPKLQRDAQDLDGEPELEKCQRVETENQEDVLEGEAGRNGSGTLYNPHLFPLLGTEVSAAKRQLMEMVQLTKCHCRRDNLWKRLYLLEPLSSDKLRLGKLSSSELKELLDAVHGRSVAEIDPQLDFLLSMSVQWYQSLIKVLLSRFPQSCRHFHSTDSSTQYLVVLNQKFTDCFVLVFLDTHSSKTSLKVVFREPFPEQPQNSESPLPQLVSTYHHLESVINTACFNLWSGLL